MPTFLYLLEIDSAVDFICLWIGYCSLVKSNLASKKLMVSIMLIDIMD
jgi:hypothetical protein